MRYTRTRSLSASFKINFCSRELLRIAWSRVYCRFLLSLSLCHIKITYSGNHSEKKTYKVYRDIYDTQTKR